MNEMIIFGGLAGLISLCSILSMTLPNPVTAAIFLVLDLFFLGALYAFQGADFVAAIQIIIYTGAILVLFLFVIMILNLDPKLLARPRWHFFEKAALALVIGGFAFVAYQLLEHPSLSERVADHMLSDNTQDLALSLFRNYLWPFEIVSMLILLAIIGSISIARKKSKSDL